MSLTLVPNRQGVHQVSQLVESISCVIFLYIVYTLTTVCFLSAGKVSKMAHDGVSTLCNANQHITNK